MSIGMKINEYLNETIQTKKNMRRRINQLDTDLREIKANNKDIIKERDMYKTKLKLLKREFTEYKKEAKQIIEELTTELKKVSK